MHYILGIPSQPLKLTIDEIGQTLAYLEWSPPENPNGIIEQYKIAIVKVCESQPKLDPMCHDICTPTESILISRETQINLENLIPWSLYEVRIAAKTSHDLYGLYSEVLRFRTRAGEPNTPEIIKTSQTKRGGLVIDFHYDCPLTGPTIFTAQHKALNFVLSNVTQIQVNLFHQSIQYYKVHFVAFSEHMNFKTPEVIWH